MPGDSISLKDVAIGDLRRELILTRRVLERLPDDEWGWKPHEKSYSLGELATHLSNLPLWLESILREDSYDLASSSIEDRIPQNREAILARFDTRCEAVRQALDELHDENLGTDYALLDGEKVVFTMPRGAALRSMGISHMIHHRAQLTVYLRLLDIPLPPVYGPTADEAIAV